jgi:hypothetical protein
MARAIPLSCLTDDPLLSVLSRLNVRNASEKQRAFLSFRKKGRSSLFFHRIRAHDGGSI